MTSPPIASRRRSSGAARAISRPCDEHRHLIAFLGLVDVLRGDQERPSGVAQTAKLVPDPAAEEGIEAGGRLVEEEDRGVVDQRAGQLESPLHPARQASGPALADRPQVEELEDLAGAPAAGEVQHPEQRRHEIDVLADGQVRDRA